MSDSLKCHYLSTYISESPIQRIVWNIFSIFDREIWLFGINSMKDSNKNEKSEGKGCNKAEKCSRISRLNSEEPIFFCGDLPVIDKCCETFLVYYQTFWVKDYGEAFVK